MYSIESIKFKGPINVETKSKASMTSVRNSSVIE